MTPQSETILMVVWWIALLAMILVTPPRNKGGRK